MYTADAGSKELFFRPQWGCPDGIHIRLEWRSLIALTHGVLFGTVPVQSLVLSSRSLAPWDCVVSSKLCNSASSHLVARPSNTVSGTFPIIPYIRFLEGQGRGNTSECVYQEGSVPFRFHLTLNFFLHFYWKTVLISIRLTRAKYICSLSQGLALVMALYLDERDKRSKRWWFCFLRWVHQWAAGIVMVEGNEYVLPHQKVPSSKCFLLSQLPAPFYVCRCQNNF